MLTPPQTITRTYKGPPDRAALLFQQDAAELTTQGYYPMSQTYTPGTWGCGAFLIALALAIVLIGILIFIYMLLVKPDGTLVVIYEYRPSEASPAPPDRTEEREETMRAIDGLADLRDRGAITPDEFEAKKRDLLARL